MPRRFLVLGILLSAIACGSFATSNEGAPDGGVDGSSNGEGGVLPDGALADGETNEDAGPPITCGRKGDFGSPTKLSALGIPKIESARFVPSTGQVYLAGVPDAGSDPHLFVRTNDANFTTDMGWFTALTLATEDNHPMPLSTNLGVLFESKRKQDNSAGDDRLYFATRPTDTSSYLAVVQTVKINPPIADLKSLEEPWILDNRIYFSVTTNSVADRLWSGIWKSETATIESAAPLLELLPSGCEEVGHPVVTKDHRRIYFSALSPTDGRLIYTATRATALSKFTTPIKLGSIAKDVYPTWVSQDDCDLYYVRDKVDLFKATRQQ